MNTELLEALEQIEKEKDISKETLLEAIENSLLTACKNHFGKADNVKVNIDPVTCQFSVYAEKTVVENVEDDVTEISLEKAREIDSKYELGDIVNVEIKSKEFGRIATQNAKNVILQKIREEERKVLFNQYYGKEKDVVTGVVQRYLGRNVSINLGKVDAILNENEMVKGEVFKPTERIKVYILEVKDQEGVYSWTGDLTEGELKFYDGNSFDYTAYGAEAANTPFQEGESTITKLSDGNDFKFYVEAAQAGNYTLTVDLKSMKLNVEKNDGPSTAIEEIESIDWVQESYGIVCDRAQSMALYDISGRKVVSVDASLLPFDGLNSGIYVLVIETSKGRMTHKIAVR